MTTAATLVKLRDEKPGKPRTLWQNAVRHIMRDKLTLAALLVLGLMTLFCLLGPPVVENVLGLDVNRTSIPDKFLSPEAEGHIWAPTTWGATRLIRLLYGEAFRWRLHTAPAS
ncbi:MAG: hypothetical protein R2911_15625 [Caldilineaceae bacterium]